MSSAKLDRLVHGRGEQASQPRTARCRAGGRGFDRRCTNRGLNVTVCTGPLFVNEAMAAGRSSRNHPCPRKAGHDIGDTPTPGLAGLVAVGVGDVIDQLGRQQRLQQSHQRHRQRVRRDECQVDQVNGTSGKNRDGRLEGSSPLVSHRGICTEKTIAAKRSGARVATNGAGTIVVSFGRKTMMIRPTATNGSTSAGTPSRSRAPPVDGVTVR